MTSPFHLLFFFPYLVISVRMEDPYHESSVPLYDLFVSLSEPSLFIYPPLAPALP